MSDSVTNTRGPESTESESADLENIAVTVALNDARGGIFFMWSKVSMLKLSVKETKKTVTDNHVVKVPSVFNERIVPRVIHTEVEVNRGRSADVDLKHDDPGYFPCTPAGRRRSQNRTSRRFMRYKALRLKLPVEETKKCRNRR